MSEPETVIAPNGAQFYLLPRNSPPSHAWFSPTHSIPTLPALPTIPCSPPPSSASTAESLYRSTLPDVVPLRQLGFGEYDCSAATKIMLQLGYDESMTQLSKKIYETESMTKHDVELLRRLITKRRCLKNLLVNNLVFVKFKKEKQLDR